MGFSGNSTQAQAIGRYGLWNTGLRDPDPSGATERAETAAELEELGYGALWLGGSSGVEHAAPLIAATRSITVATGILSIWQHEPQDTAERWAALEAAHPGRFLLGLGVSHAKLAEQYKRPYAAMTGYLDALDAAGSRPAAGCWPRSAPECWSSPATAPRALTPTWSPPSTRLRHERHSARGPCWPPSSP